MKRKQFILLGALILLLIPGGSALAQDAALPVCTGDAIAGTVVAVDAETGLATIEDADGIQCTTTFTDDYDHPITSLLAAYFNNTDAGDLGDALETLTVCAVYDDVLDTWSTVEVAEGEECEGTEVTVTTANEDGTFTAEDEAGEEVTLSFDDEEEAGDLSGALDALVVDWGLTEDGSVADVGDDIAAYHDEDGIGFGVLVKVYAIAEASETACAEEDAEAVEAGEEVDTEEPCGVSADELVLALEEGYGLGQLFHMYGKPAMLGVGHIRTALADGSGYSVDLDGDGEEDCKSGGGHDMGTHTGHVDCVTLTGGSTGLPSADKTDGDDDGDDD